MAAVTNKDGSLPRVFLIQSPTLDQDPNPTRHGFNLVLGYDAVNKVLTLQAQPPGSLLPNQLFRANEDGLIQNVGQEDSGYLTRAFPDSESAVGLAPLIADAKDQTNRQIWDLKAGPVPQLDPDKGPLVPGSGPNGTEKFTIVVAGNGLELVLTAKQLGGAVTVEPTPIPEGRRLPDEQLFYFFWIPRLV